MGADVEEMRGGRRGVLVVSSGFDCFYICASWTIGLSHHHTSCRLCISDSFLRCYIRGFVDHELLARRACAALRCGRIDLSVMCIFETSDISLSAAG